MDIYLTNGFNGDKTISLVEDLQDASAILDIIDEWKSRKETKTKFKVEPYNSFTFCGDCVVVDFGDYHAFIEIGNMTADEYKSFEYNLHNI